VQNRINFFILFLKRICVWASSIFIVGPRAEKKKEEEEEEEVLLYYLFVMRNPLLI
jgi:hypothetical protein